MNNDHKLKEAVLAELDWEPSVTADHIGVTAEGGVITLTGHVNSYWQKSAAERAVGRVQGVRAIAEEIEVSLSGSVLHTDEDIAKAALHRLAWDASIPKDVVKIKVEKGFVTLTGEVPWHYQHDEAARTLRTLEGVTGVTNQIKVKHQPDTGRIESEINKALHRSMWAYDHVEVSANEGKVHLTGKVESWQDRRMAWATAWRASGTTSVKNDIRVK
ncbi:BON domain-containing protein [Sulfitobacter guttiformis]|uniref:Osmotically-inducible protein OsmY n=1 Tax=Sulfitobacter guttiformis TaxID=74349 RepID=A0A420DJB7_9RHOB|nr:BON domain-containing protein [Sulfitobacter guttiformis]KIN71897.1 Transport-associated protein [Sulfitobacter guttiformis KCTC 32187]RKE94294.1 osmotically-inducible protein OsmY [Sulfitobacter guttiformis]